MPFGTEMLIGRANETNFVNSKFSCKDAVALSAPFTSVCSKFLGLFYGGLSVLSTNHLTNIFSRLYCKLQELKNENLWIQKRQQKQHLSCFLREARFNIQGHRYPRKKNKHTDIPHSAARLHFIETVSQRLRSFTTLRNDTKKVAPRAASLQLFIKKVTACCNWMRTLIVEEFVKEQSYCSNNSTTSLGFSVKWNLFISLPFYSDQDNFKSSNSILVT